MPQISVIIPLFNKENFIENTLKSVTAQTFSDFEIIIINDGSTDNGAEIVLEFNDHRIKFFHTENKGVSAARNFGIEIASGDYVAFLDADDIWMCNKLEVQLSQIISKNVDLIFCAAYVMDSESVVDKNNILIGHHGFLSYDNGLNKMIERNRVPILTVLVKKDKVIQVGMFSEKTEIQNAEDVHLWIRLLLNKLIFYGSKQILAIYRIHKDSVSKTEKDSLKLYVNVLSDIGLNNKDINFKILYHLINKQNNDLERLENEIKIFKKSFYYKIKSISFKLKIKLKKILLSK